MSPKNLSKLTCKNQQRQRFLKLFHSLEQGKIKVNYIKIVNENPGNPQKKIKPVELRLILASKTEKRLREYVKKQFNLTLEQKLMDVLIQWIGKALKYVHENGK